VVLRWPPATDNVGVVGYDVVRDDTVLGSMTAALRMFRDTTYKPGVVHAWRVVARDDAGLATSSAPIIRTIRKPAVSASVVALRMAGGGKGAARYSLRPRQRLLVDVRVIGTLARPTLRLYVSSGNGRITVFRGIPGTSSPRIQLGSVLARHGFVTIPLSHALHAGRIRLVLIAGSRVVIAAKAAQRPAIRAG
jgi:hypothetical protein